MGTLTNPFLISGAQPLGAPLLTPDTTQPAARFRWPPEAANIGDWEWDIEADAVTLSREAGAMLGLPLYVPGARLRKDWPRICHPGDLPQIAMLKVQAVEGMSPVLVEIRIRRLGEEGEYRRVFLRGHAGTGPTAWGRLSGQIIDVTEQRHEEALFRRVTEALPGMLYLLDLKNDAIEHLNDGHLAFIPDGPSRGIEATHALMALVPVEELPKLSRHRQDCLALKDGEVAEGTFRLRLHDGTDRWIHSQRRSLRAWRMAASPGSSARCRTSRPSANRPKPCGN